MLGKHGKVTRRLAAVALGGALLVGLGACNTEDQNALIVYGPDSAVVVAPMIQPAFLLEPEGDGQITKLILTDFDLSNPDAFGRATSEFGYTWDGDNFDYDPGARIASNDPRSPALGSSGTEVSTNCRFGEGSWWGGEGGFDFYCFIDGLKPNTDYSVLFYRYALTVNGQLDHTEMLLTGNITAPDALTPLGGTPGGYPTEECDFDEARPTFTVGVTGNQNPLNMGYVTSSGAGGVVFDCLIGSGDYWVQGAELLDPAESPHGPNTLASYGLPRYNYIVIYEGVGTPADPIPPGPAVMRYQVSVDIDASGNPIPNSFAPYPDAILSLDELALADYALSVPDSVLFEFTNLSAMASGGGYKLWAQDAGGATQALDFTYTLLDNEGAPVNPSATASFFDGGPGVHQLVADYPGAADAEITFFLSAEASSGAASPANIPLFMHGTVAGQQGFGSVKTLSVPPIMFGTREAADPDEFRLWTISGRGTGGLFGDEFRERYEHLPRPPAGYKYVTWLASGDTLFVRLPDESFTSPPPEYAVLETADTDDTISDVVQPLEILAAFSKICLTEVSGCQGPYDLGAYDTFILTLEPRAGVSDEIGPTRVLEGLIPTPKPRE